MRSESNSNQFEFSNHFEKSFRLHGHFTAYNLEIRNHFQKLFRLHSDFYYSNFSNHNKILTHMRKW